MKTRFYKYVVVSLIAVLGLTGFTGCGDDITKEYYEVGASLETHWFTVKANQWTWNASTERYEFISAFPELDDYMFDEGLIDASMYVPLTIDGNTTEALVKLPYVQTYTYTDNTINTENIGCEIYLTPYKEIVFYIQTLMLNKPDKYTYQFKINFVLNKKPK